MKESIHSKLITKSNDTVLIIVIIMLDYLQFSYLYCFVTGTSYNQGA
jgi:hypothetical protein